MRVFKSRGWKLPTSLALAATAVVLMALPRRWTDPVRLAGLSGLRPIRAVADSIRHGWEKLGLFGDAERVSEAEKQVAYWRDEANAREIELQQARRAMEALAEFPSDAGADPARRLVATVILPADASLWRRSMVLACGGSQGVRPGDWVVWKNHLLGKVAEVSPLDCRVQLVTSAGFKVGARVAPRGTPANADPAKGRMGVVEGMSADRARMKWLLDDAGAAEGAAVVTAGDPAAGLPRGLMIGRIRDEGLDRMGYRKLGVEPEIKVLELDTVVVLRKRQE
jgi:cell shape-determining protein MreC